MWEQICDTLAEWWRFYVIWGKSFIKDVGPSVYGYTLMAVAFLGWALMKGRNSYEG